MMRGAVFQRPEDGISFEELVLDAPKAGEVEVRMIGAGVCHSDLHTRDGDWPLSRLTVLGHEGAADVERVGEGVEGLVAGDRVILSWNAPCGRCLRCTTGRPWLCVDTGAQRNAMTDGTTRVHRQSGEDVWPYCGIGVFAERQVVPASAAIKVPRETPAAVAALIGCAVATGVGAVVNTAAVEPGASVAIVGLGGVGLSAVMGAALAGATPIIAIDVEPAKLELARALGATHAVLAGDAEAEVERITAPWGPDYVVEAVGAPPTLELAGSLLRRGGTLVLVGMAAKGKTFSFEQFPFVDGGRTILASNYGSTVPVRDFPRLARLHVEGRLPVDRLIEAEIPLDDLEDALDRLRRRVGSRRVVVY
jgi:S-(hydroxymethyl)glutathione dehydrogenase / alcohol dehydrogenase